MGNVFYWKKITALDQQQYNKNWNGISAQIGEMWKLVKIDGKSKEANAA